MDLQFLRTAKGRRVDPAGSLRTESARRRLTTRGDAETEPMTETRAQHCERKRTEPCGIELTEIKLIS